MLLAWRVSSARNLPGASSDFAGFPCSGTISQFWLRRSPAMLVQSITTSGWDVRSGAWRPCRMLPFHSAIRVALQSSHCSRVWLPKLVRPSQITFLPVLIKKVLAAQTWCTCLMCRTQARSKTRRIFIIYTWRKQSASEYCLLSVQRKLPALWWEWAEYFWKKFKKKLLEDQRLDLSVRKIPVKNRICGLKGKGRCI